MGIQLITEKIDLNRLSKKDTLLNPSDRGLSGRGGLDRIIHSLGGKKMREHARKQEFSGKRNALLRKALI